MRRLRSASEKDLKEAYGWLAAFKDIYIRDYYVTYSKVPQSVWDWYKVTGLKDMPEQKMLSEVVFILHKRWRERPSILTRDTNGT